MLSGGRVVRIALDPPLSFTFCDDSFRGGGGITLCWPFHSLLVCSKPQSSLTWPMALSSHTCTQRWSHARKLHTYVNILMCAHRHWSPDMSTSSRILDSLRFTLWTGLVNKCAHVHACMLAMHTYKCAQTHSALPIEEPAPLLHTICSPNISTQSRMPGATQQSRRMSARETEVHHITLRKQEGGLNETEMMSRWVERGTPKGTERDISSKTRKWVLKKTHTDRKSVNESETSQKSEEQKGVIFQEIPGESAWNWGGVMTRVMVDWRTGVIKYNQSERKDYLLCFSGVCNCSKKNTVTCCDNKTQSFQCDAGNYKDGDKDGDNSKKMARKDSADYQCWW